MKKLGVNRRLTAAEATERIGEAVVDLDPTIDEESIVYDADTGEPILLYARLPLNAVAAQRYRTAVRNVPMSTTLRSTGMRNSSRTFGMAKRNVVLKRESCRAASIDRDAPAVHRELLAVSTHLAKQLEEHLPYVVAKDRETVNDVLPEWRMTPGSVWTSGVVNLSSALPYHRDRANFPTWSAMPVLRRGTTGGFLNIPEYDITLACRDGMVVYFNGAGLLHGVTPIRSRQPDGYRYSIVHYSIRGMKDCHTEAIEQGEALRRRTAREESKGLPNEQ